MGNASKVLSGGKILDVKNCHISEGNVRIDDGIITAVDPPDTMYDESIEKIDITGKYLSPGFIDSHLHIESTMLSPIEFAKKAVEHGTTAVFVDPHEITNIAGKQGLELFLNQADIAPIDIFIAIPSCVPASEFEESGAVITPEDIREYLPDPRIYGLGEMMNYPAIISGQGDSREKVQIVYDYGKIVDGHCPDVTGDDLLRYISNGENDNIVRIMSDHESTGTAEVLEKQQAGMWLMLRYGSNARDLVNILPDLVRDHVNLDQFMLCSDDLDPLEFYEDGHVNRIIRRARDIFLQIADIDIEEATIRAISLATAHPGEYFSKFFQRQELPGIGSIEPGKRANLLVLDSLQDLQVETVFHHGTRVVDNGKFTGDATEYDYSDLLESMRIGRKIGREDFHIEASNRQNVRAIGVTPGSLKTDSLQIKPPVKHGVYQADPERDIAKIAVIERHHRSGKHTVGFVHGLGLRRGAIASTVAHDAHNLIIAGMNDDAMVRAGNFLADQGGGMAVVVNEDVTYLPLRIGGLMSTDDAGSVAEQFRKLKQATRDTGSEMDQLFMTLSFLALSVIPELKITSGGLVEVNEFTFVPLEV